MEESQGEIQNLGFVLEATLPDTSGSAPDFGRARSTKNERRPRPNGHPNHFITPTTAERPSRLWTGVLNHRAQSLYRHHGWHLDGGAKDGDVLGMIVNEVRFRRLL